MRNMDWVLVALLNLSGDVKSVDLEDIAIETYNLEPRKFCWRKYPKNIDKALVRFSLEDASEKKHGLLVRRMPNKSWMLTSQGAEEAKNILKKMSKIESDASLKSKSRSNREFYYNREKQHLLASKAYQKYSLGQKEDINIYDVYSLLKVNEYFSKTRIRERMQKLENLFSEEKDIADFLVFLRGRFLTENQGGNKDDN